MPNTDFAFSEKCDTRKWIALLMESGNWRSEASGDAEETFFDTFDWRLYRRKNRLALVREPHGQSLACLSFSGVPIAGLEPASPPGFVRDLPSGRLREHLEPIVSMRRLLPLFTIRGRQQRLALLNPDGKTVLRMLISSGRSVEERGTIQALPPRLHLLPVLGYEEEHRRLLALFHEDPHLHPSPRSDFEQALSVTNLRPAEYTSKVELHFQPDDCALDALKQILQSLVRVMMTNLPGLKADIDTEFLHDFRVSVRRARSAVGQLKQLLAPGEAAAIGEELAWLGTITGPVRDLDVYLLEFDSYRQLVPEAHRDDLVPFRDFLARLRVGEREKMLAALDSDRFSSFVAGWEDPFLRREEGSGCRPIPVKEVADRRIWRLYRRCMKQGTAVTDDSPPEAMHELRKTCKKLRYLLEFFRSLHPPGEMATVIDSLKDLQDNLGSIQDLQVQSGAVQEFGLRMAERESATPAVLLAMGRLAEELTRHQLDEREEFHRRFARFRRTGGRRALFSSLFRHPNGREHKSHDRSGDI